MLLGDRSKAEEKLGWKPEYVIEELVEDMIKKDLVKFKSS
jgi:GDPmannose 4,6-dehydratase